MTREGLKFLIPSLAVWLILLAVWAFSSEMIILPLVVISFLVSLFLGFFFRDPARQTPGGDDLILSSADGRVISIKPFENADFVGEKGTLVSR
jgi:phosphatidylserine decarboxylase